METGKSTIEQLKAEALAAQADAQKHGRKLKHGHALEAVAQAHGYANWRAARAACERTSESLQSPSVPEASAATLNATTADTLYRLHRSNDTPLRFRGIEIGEGVVDSEEHGYYNRTTIYRTSAGKYIAETVVDDSSAKRPFRHARVFEEPEAMVAWLRDPESGTLDRTRVVALAAAARKDPLIDRAFGQDVE